MWGLFPRDQVSTFCSPEPACGTYGCRSGPVEGKNGARRTPVPREVEIILDDARPGCERIRRFARPRAIVEANAPGDVAGALEVLERERRAAGHVAGYFSYELGYVLEPKLNRLLPQMRDVPLLWFGIFDDCEVLEGDAARCFLDARMQGRNYAGPLAHEWDRDAYAAHFNRVHALIAAGDIYQTNLSLRSRFATVGDPMALYLRLRENSGAAHGAFIDDGERHILSLSPELFFSIARDGEIVARPMKGTAPRDADPAKDNALRAHLATSEKDRAENLMIVDLLRNDLGRIAQMGSVSVSELFKIETYPTLHTMVSTLRAKLRAPVSVGNIARALFPCGSVTGAPKIRAMEVIRDLEESPRGVYCGAIGTFSPDGAADFNVAIRTLTLSNGRGELGIGGAVVHDSRAIAEYNECLLKSRYYETVRKPLELIETLRHSPDEGFVRLNFHLDRMEKSSAAFGIPFDRESAILALEQTVSGEADASRVRLTVDELGVFVCTRANFAAPSPVIWKYVISSVPVSSADLLLRHKTNWRTFYETEAARFAHCDEVLFLNERGALTEGSRTNIFVRKNGNLLTPPLDEGVLDGCLRRALIECGQCVEAVLCPRDLQDAEAVFLGNSLRGLIEAVRAG
jgi:para-aminobenzoate synthetase/4-amino-4-deoxychorismate lyase